MRKNFIKGLALGMAVCMGVVGCGTNSTSTPETSTGAEDETTTEAGSDETTTEAGDNLFPAYDFGGITITLLNANDLGGKNPASTDDEFQKEERQAWLDEIQTKYNVVLEFVDSPAAEWDDTPQELVNAYTAGQPIADVMDVYYNWIGPLITNDILCDMTEIFDNSDEYLEANVFDFLGKKWGICSAISGEGLYYNTDMIKEAGMDYTPGEMFDMGKWSYDDFYEYCVELKANMAEDEYPLFVAPYYWALFASAANGVHIFNETNGHLEYVSDAFLETMEFYQTLVNEGLAAIPDKTSETSWNNWGYPGSTFDAGVTVAMAHRASWQAAGLVEKFDLGFVPYPWGSNVTIDADKVGQEGAYLTLSDNYESSYYDGQCISFIKGIEEKADPMQLTSMMCELLGWGWSKTASESAGISKPGWIEEDKVDSDLYVFSREREHLEFYNSIDLPFTMVWTATFYEDRGVRATLQSAYNADMALVVEAGFADESMYNPSEE